jgi:uncharacterized phage protein gp47/JayE
MVWTVKECSLKHVSAQIKGGKQLVKGESIVIQQADEVLIYVATDTDFKGKDFERTTTETLAKALKNPIASSMPNIYETIWQSSTVCRSDWGSQKMSC